MKLEWSSEPGSFWAVWQASKTIKLLRNWAFALGRWEHGANALPRKVWLACRIARDLANRRPNPADLKQRILRQLEQPAPPGLSSWDGGSLAHALGVSDDAIWRVFARRAFSCGDMRSWREHRSGVRGESGRRYRPVSGATPECAGPQRGREPSIQALESKTGYVQTSSGKIVRGMKSTYRRHGTINLFAALNVATGVIQSKRRPASSARTSKHSSMRSWPRLPKTKKFM